MQGLLDRAIRFRRVASRLEDEARGAPSGEEGVSSDEKALILEEIDRLMDAERHVTLPERAASRKRGLALPIALNAAILAALAGGVALFQLGGREGPELAGGAGTTRLAAETRLIEALRREATSTVEERDRRIAAIRAELAAISARAAAAYGAARATDAAEAARRAEEAERERALRAELESLRGTAESMKSEAELSLAAMAQTRERESFFLDQLRVLYREAGSLATAGDAQAARERCAAAGRLLEGYEPAGGEAFATALRQGQASLDASLALAQARDAELSRTRSLLAEPRGAADAGREEALEAARADERAKAGAERAALEERLARAGERASLAEGKLPLAEAKLSQAEAKLSLAEARASGLADELSASEAKRAEREALDAERTRRVQAASAALSRDLGSARERAAGSGPVVPAAEAELLGLLDTKLLLREIALSPQVRDAHPELYSDMERLFAAMGSEKEDAGRKAAYADAARVLEGLVAAMEPLPGGGGAPRAATRPEPRGDADGADGAAAGALSFLDGLDRLLAGLIDRLR